jgi:hypothetical protein
LPGFRRQRGIGAATVRELLKVGIGKIYAGARDVKSLPDFADARVVPLQLDITDDSSVKLAAAAADDVDVLLNNAGTMAFGDWVTGPEEVVDADMQTNFYGTLRVIRASRHPGKSGITVIGIYPARSIRIWRRVSRLRRPQPNTRRKTSCKVSKRGRPISSPIRWHCKSNNSGPATAVNWRPRCKSAAERAAIGLLNRRAAIPLRPHAVSIQ